MKGKGQISRKLKRDDKYKQHKKFAAKFFKKLPTEEDRLDELFNQANKWKMVRCHHCGGDEIERECGSRIIFCTTCRNSSSFTSGTIFHRVRHLDAWLLAIRLMEQGLCLTAWILHILANISYSTAHNILMKLMSVIESQMPANAVLVPSSLYSPRVCKRSRFTPAQQHPTAEQDEIDEKAHAARSDRIQATNTKPLSETESVILDLLSNEPVSFDTLCRQTGLQASQVSTTLTMLELSELASSTSGNRYVRSTAQHQQNDTWIDSNLVESTFIVVAHFFDFARQYRHGTSRKNLQLFLAAFWCYMDRERWRAGTLLKACLLSGPINYLQLLSYVTPNIVKMLPATV